MKNYYLVALISIAFFAISCGQANTSSKLADIKSREWQVKLLHTDSTTIENFEHPLLLQFNDSTNMLYGSGGCNRFFGSYEFSGKDSVAVKVGGSTMAYCPWINIESAYFDLLETTKTYDLQKDELILKGEKGKTIITLVPAINQNN